jgi:hypothetical protein
VALKVNPLIYMHVCLFAYASIGFSDSDHSEFGVVLTACTNPPPQVCPFIVPTTKCPFSEFQLYCLICDYILLLRPGREELEMLHIIGSS